MAKKAEHTLPKWWRNVLLLDFVATWINCYLHTLLFKALTPKKTIDNGRQFSIEGVVTNRFVDQRSVDVRDLNILISSKLFIYSYALLRTIFLRSVPLSCNLMLSFTRVLLFVIKHKEKNMRALKGKFHQKKEFD